jgi:acyl-CoA synthetase (AMP-forming)/AMP-acid ligase II
VSANPYETDLDRNEANYQPLTPLAHLERTALIHPDHVAIIHGSLRISYATFLKRSKRLANALVEAGIGKGDTVSVMLSNTPAMLEAHHGVPMTGAVLHSINTRLDAQAIAFQLDHAETKILIVTKWDSISLNYTSGTTGNPKGVVYHHRGAALLGWAMSSPAGMGAAPGLSLDAADVPLQRLVLPWTLSSGGDPCLPALGPRQGDV